MPLPTLDLLRNADPLLGLALVMLVGMVAADALYRAAKLPRPAGLMLVGALASPFALAVIARSDLDPWKPLLDLAIGALVFELGSRIRPRWLIDNPALAASCVLEGLVAGGAVAAALLWLGATPLSAALAGAVAMASSPVLAIAMIHELHPRGQVTERMLLATAVNSVLAMLALKAWGVMAATGWPGLGGEWFTVGADAVYVVCGSFLLGAATGTLLHRLARATTATASVTVLQIALVILATVLSTQWRLSPLLALLVAGVMARRAMGHRLTVEPHLGSAGAVLAVLLFISLGLLITLDGGLRLWPWALAIILARAAAKLLALLATARWSGLGWRQAMALALALQPMSSLAVLLASDSFGWARQFASAEVQAVQALLLAAAVMQLAGPLFIQFALRGVAREAEAAPAHARGP